MPDDPNTPAPGTDESGLALTGGADGVNPFGPDNTRVSEPFVRRPEPERDFTAREQPPTLPGSLSLHGNLGNSENSLVIDRRERPPKLRGDISIEKQRENVREHLAKFLVRTLATFLVATVALLIFAKGVGLEPATLKSYFDPILAALITLVSTVLGFYYGSGTSKNTDKDE